MPIDGDKSAILLKAIYIVLILLSDDRLETVSAERVVMRQPDQAENNSGIVCV